MEWWRYGLVIHDMVLECGQRTFCKVWEV